MSPDWEREFEEFPPAFHRLLADLLYEVEVERDRDQGVKPKGRRPARTGGGMQEILDVVYPRRSMKPFGEALSEASKMTDSAVAKMAGMNPGTLYKLRHGREPLTKDKIEAIARVLHVDPGYFHEYRVLVIHEAIDALLTPHRSLQAYASVEREHRKNPRPKTLNVPNGYGTNGRQVFANRAKTGREVAK